MYNVENKKPYVATYKEILIGFLTFALILIVLYPKDLLEKQILSEEANYDLSMLYLQNMLQNDPDNEELMFNLAKQSLRGNKRDLAYRLLKLLKSSKSHKMQQKAYLLSYKIAKEDYYYLLKDKKYTEAKKLLQEMRELNRFIIMHHFYSPKDLEKLYEESLFLQDKKSAYLLLQKLLYKDSKIEYLQTAYYLANELHYYDAALKYLDMLIAKDPQHTKKWEEAKYFILYHYKSPKLAQHFLEKEAEKSAYWREKLSYFYLANKKYKDAAYNYMILFSKTKSYKKRLYYWLQALKTLQAGNYLKEASQLAAQHQTEFLGSKEARIYLLKLYLAANDLKRANKLAQEILQLKRERQR
jgi:hypothetical protein